MSAETYASVDIGSNTILLLVARRNQDGGLVPVHQEQRFPRLGQGLQESGLLAAQNMAKALEYLREYRQIAAEYGVRWMRMVATAAVREARNGDRFVQKVWQELGLQVEVLQPEQEAKLAFLGALANKRQLTGRVVVADVGGGSTEFVWGKPGEPEGWISFPVGSVKLTERFALQNKTRPDRIRQAAAYFRSVLSEKLPRITDHLVGTAGTFTTIAAILQGLERYDADRVDGYRASWRQLEELVERLAKMNAGERLRLPGVDPGREDVILGGAIIAREVLRYFGQKQVIISDRGLRYGAILERLQNQE